MTNYSDRLTIKQAQQNQPWTVPYSEGVQHAASVDTEVLTEGGVYEDRGPLVPHILGTHCVLHAVKSLGKIAAVYEARDHDVTHCVESNDATGVVRRAEIRKMAADLMTAALRFANLEGFDLAEALVERVKEKNGADFGRIAAEPPEHFVCPVCKQTLCECDELDQLAADERGPRSWGGAT